MTTIEGGCTRARRRRRSHALPRRKTVRWSPAEVDGLLDGVREHGVGKWAAILRSSACFNAVRTSVDLKDKWRNLAAHVRALALQTNVGGATGTPITSTTGIPTSPTTTTTLGIPTTTATTSTTMKPEPMPTRVATNGMVNVNVHAPNAGHRTIGYNTPGVPPPLHPTSTLPPLAPSTTYGHPVSAAAVHHASRYTPRVLAPLPVPSLAPTTAEDAVAVASQLHHHHHHAAAAAAAVAAAATHHGHHDLSYFGESFGARPATPGDTLAQLRSLPPPNVNVNVNVAQQHHTHHDAVPTAASPTAPPPPPALNFDPFPEPDL